MQEITSKQRSRLKAIAANLQPVTQIGKGGITDNLLKGLSDALEAHEIIKVTLLPTVGEEAENLAENVAELLDAVPVAVIGRKAIFYRRFQRQSAIKAPVHKNIAPRFVFYLRRNRRDFAQTNHLRREFPPFRRPSPENSAPQTGNYKNIVS